jgi:hypothetical protein
MAEYRMTITVSEHGHRDVAEDRMEQLLEAFERAHPEVGAVVGANYHRGRLDATFLIDAPSAREANDLGSDVFASAMADAGLELTKIIEINCAAVGETSADDADRDLVAAWSG